MIHASAYKDPAQLRGRKVLVVGGGNTGCDIAVEAAQQATHGLALDPARLLVRARSTSSAAPPTRSTTGCCELRLPLRLRQWLYHRTLRLTVGDLTRFGLPDARPPPVREPPDRQQPARLLPGPRPDHPGAGRRPLRRRRGGADRRPARRARPGDHRDRLPAAVRVPRARSCSTSTRDGRPDLHLHAFARKHPTLAVVGLLQPDAGLFPLAHWQSVAVARWLRLRVADPVRAAAVQQKRVDPAGRPLDAAAGGADSTRHWFEVSHTDYLRGACDGAC